MRLIDLITFIRTSSEMFYRQTLTDYARLELIKVAFPRQDLIKWFDSRAVFPIPPERYMLLLFLSAANVLVPRDMIHLHYGSEHDLALLRGLRVDTDHSEYREVVIDRSSGVESEFGAFARYDTGLIQGIVDDEAELGRSAVSSALSLPARNARRICIMPMPMYQSCNGMRETWQGFPVHSGVLQYWPTRVTAVVFHSYMPAVPEAA